MSIDRKFSLPMSALIILATIPVLCFSQAGAGPGEQKAQDILDATGVKGGLIVHVGCGDGVVTAALGMGESYLVHGLDSDPANVQTARAYIRGLGVYGKVSIDLLEGDTLPYADNLINLLVLEDGGDIPANEVMRVLCPEGVAYAKSGDTWTKTFKARPPEIDEWTHYLYDSTNNAVAHDSVVGPPRRYQWIGSPQWSRHHDRMASMSACVAAGGRIFYILDKGSRVSIQLPSRWALVARDAFNGTILWERPISAWMTQYWPFKSGPAQLPRRLVAVGDRVYVTLGLDDTALSVLDAATGETIRTYDATAMAEEFICSEGVLFVMVKENPPATRWNEFLPIHRAVGTAKTRVADEWPWDEADRRLTALNAETGQVLWQKEYPIAPLTLTADAKGVFFHDSQRIVCLDRFTGNELWRSSDIDKTSPMAANFGPTLVVQDDVVMFGGGNPSRIMTALSAETGQTLWTSTYAPSGHNSPHDLFVIDGLAWAGATAGGGHSGVFTGWDLHTGQVMKEFPPDIDIYWFHHRCYRSKATDHYIMTSRTGIEFIDFRTEHWITNHWVRGGCLYGIMPCNGLVYAPPHDCACYAETKLSGFCALAPAHAEIGYPQAAPDLDRLETGPAYGGVASVAPGFGDWPTYRGDMERSGHTRQVVPADLEALWQTELGGNLTSPTIADGRLYVASVDEHILYALSDQTGAIVWSRTVGGRVDSPPTYHNGKVIFGGADGYVYCLRASDGELVWRFQAAPRDIRMTSFEQLESVWPVSGSVLVLDDVVYCIAGRSMFLDGGLRFIRLDAETGSKLTEVVLDDRDPQTLENLQVHVKGLNMPVGLADVLSSNGERVFMRSQQFDLQGNRFQIAPYSNDSTTQASQQHGEGSHLFAPFGLLDGSWFHRSYWIYGRSTASGAGGYYRAGWFAPAGRILAFDDERVYGFGREPQYFKWTTPMEYHLFATDKEPPPTDTSGGGTTMIEVANTASLDPTGKAITVEAWVKAEKADGAIIARGGGTNGYALTIDGGRPSFMVCAASQLSTVRSTEDILDRWVHLAGVLTADKELQIYVDGELSASTTATDFVASDPCQPMHIGADERGGVGDYESPYAFTGVIDEVKVFFGPVGAGEIGTHLSQAGPVASDAAELVLCYSFDTGDAVDESGYNNHGVVEGAQPVQGKFGSAMRFAASITSGTSSRMTYHWTHGVPLFTRAMVLADKMLFVAGPEDILNEEQVFDYWSADAGDPAADPNTPARLTRQDAILEGDEGASLWAVSTADGQRLTRYDLESIPVWDGMAAANGRLYMCLENGKVQAFGGTNYPPEVDAGEDQSVYPMGGAVLGASVTDDGLPKVDPADPGSPAIGVTANWMKVSGPGTVSFHDPCSVDTVVSFSARGDYRLRLTAFDGSTPYYDDINVSVARYGDLDRDDDVDIFDLAAFVSRWLYVDCDYSNDWCDGADQTASGNVDLSDYVVASAVWMDGVFPAAPADLEAVGANASVSLDWDDNAEEDLAGYDVYRSLWPDSGFVKINGSLATDSEYVDATAAKYITWYYQVKARDTFGYSSDSSNIVSAAAGIQPAMKLVADLGVSTTGTAVNLWRDQVGSNNASQSASNAKPELVESAINGRAAIKFDGVDDYLGVADSDDINTGGPYSGKTLAVVFKTSDDIVSRQVIWEQGGGVRGLNFYMEQGRLYINGWNRNETAWQPTALNAAVTANKVYVAIMVLDAGAGTFSGYVNGSLIGVDSNVAQLYNHSDDCGFGHAEGATRFHDGTNTSVTNFSGWLAEFHQYNRALSNKDRMALEGALMTVYRVLAL